MAARKSWVKDQPVDMERVRQLLAYDADTGAFTWLRNRKGSAARVGALAGCHRPDGYVRIVIDGWIDYAHRWAWRLAVGSIPPGMEIDHIDHNPSNNALSNLRLVTRSGNRRNRSRDSRNKSGINGVHWSENAQAWSVQIRCNRKTTHIGYFKDLQAAAIARKNAEASFGFHPNHGATK